MHRQLRRRSGDNHRASLLSQNGSFNVESDSDRLRTFVGLMNSGKYSDACEMLSENLTIHEPAVLPYGGELRGVAGFDEFRRLFRETWKSWSDGPIWYSENAGTVVKLNVIQAVSRQTGRSYSTPLAEFFTFENGKITDITVFYQDIPGFLSAIGKG